MLVCYSINENEENIISLHYFYDVIVVFQLRTSDVLSGRILFVCVITISLIYRHFVSVVIFRQSHSSIIFFRYIKWIEFGPIRAEHANLLEYFCLYNK